MNRGWQVPTSAQGKYWNNSRNLACLRSVRDTETRVRSMHLWPRRHKIESRFAYGPMTFGQFKPGVLLLDFNAL